MLPIQSSTRSIEEKRPIAASDAAGRPGTTIEVDELGGKVPDIIPDILAIFTCNTCCAWHRVESKILRNSLPQLSLLLASQLTCSLYSKPLSGCRAARRPARAQMAGWRAV
eukprot:COSAG05_NODE_10558_length_558_cov_1167.836601_1_plen_111_part_00